jgi:excinuclease ABC subunit C
MDLREKAGRSPKSPGIYIMKNARERPLYVGKAKNLRNRLSSYFRQSASLDDRIAAMVREVADFDFVVTKNELEALALEANFIKRLKPRYNVVLRDDKNYPYIRLTLHEEWPRLEVVRRIVRDGSLYFGPYIPAGAMWEMLDFIRRNFPIRVCRYNLSRPFRPCVQYQMGRCLAPCSADHRSEEDHQRYMETVEEVQRFIRGEKRELLEGLRHRMKRMSDELRYEEAALIRDRLGAIEKAWRSQRVIAPELGDMDLIGLFREGQEATFFMLFIRNGLVLGQRDFFLKKVGEIDDGEMLASFIEQFYSKEFIVPPRVVVPFRTDLATQRMWLGKKRGGRVKLSVPSGETERKLLRMAVENAGFAHHKHKQVRIDPLLVKIKEMLDLDVVPERISAVDISNISGAESVGAVVTFEGGKFVKDDYRLFKIKKVSGIDDFAMIGEVTERFCRNIAEGKATSPDLLLIDGGPGQLDASLRAIDSSGFRLNTAAIAKARSRKTGRKEDGINQAFERVYLPGRRSPVYLEPGDPATHLLQRIRDEVHRVAIGYHKKLRKKRTLESPLEKVRGIGKKRRLMLLRHFRSIDAIRNASIDEIASVSGMNRKVAEELKRELGDGHLRHRRMQPLEQS